MDHETKPGSRSSKPDQINLIVWLILELKQTDWLLDKTVPNQHDRHNTYIMSNTFSSKATNWTEIGYQEKKKKTEWSSLVTELVYWNWVASSVMGGLFHNFKMDQAHNIYS